MKRLVVTVVAAALLVAMSASGVVAKTTKVQVAGTATIIQPIGIGSDTWVGSVESMRGLVLLEYGNWNNTYLTGPQVGIVNFDLDHATGRGEMWGSDHHDVTAVPGGGWDCTFQATIVDFLATGKGVCHGTGTLHTWQWRADMHMIWGSPVTQFTGYFFKPGN